MSKRSKRSVRGKVNSPASPTGIGPESEWFRYDLRNLLDCHYLAAVREHGFIDEPFPKKPVEEPKTRGAGAFVREELSDR
jgi:hypothetical protein